ncbi:MAG: adenylate/guanylate cyclase domain-containing protein [Verrucomicrobia bacterium]|nr:adenylate/guanylate cyclase domain-containing protein [Verrucomicrobiota bacterium]
MPPPDNTLPPEAWLELPDGRTFWLRGPCAIGRQPDNDLVLDLPALSRRHALLTPEGDGYTLSDLHSRNGTFVNRAAITRPVTLRDRDEIRLGDALVRFRCTRRLVNGAGPADFAATQRLDDVRERPCWLLLVDVVGFTTLNERLGSEAAVRQMQAWITAIRPLIEGHDGHINGYLGDAIFAYWLADTTAPSALLASLRAIERWRPASPLAFRVVAHHGKVLFTHSDRGEELTGQDVNFAFRSEKLAKIFGVPAMLSETAMRTLGLEGCCASCGQAPLDGISGTFSFFTLPNDLTADASA